MNSMQGKLWKWTNYMSGWQPRWFVLESGVLSYYISQEEVTQGSRRSYKAASCDVNVDKNDELRMHIITPDNAYIYLRAANKVDRQKWVVALASAKLEDTAVDKPVQQETIRGGRASKTKSTELRETCNHLLTQVRSIKMASTKSPPDVKSMEALASTLTITCDDFLRLVQECMDLSHNHSAPVTPVGFGGAIDFLDVSPRVKRGSVSDDEARSRPHNSQATHNSLPPSHPPTTHGHNLTASLPAHLTASRESPDRHVRFDKSDSESTPTNKEPKETAKKTHSRSSSDVFITPTGTPSHTPPPSPTPDAHASTPSQSNTVRERALANQSQRPMFEHVTIKTSTEEQRKFETFFSRATPSFGDLVLQEKDGIPSKEFLDCARVMLPFFDALSPTAFAPVKADVGGNIEKASNKFVQDTSQYTTLQVIIEHELATDTAGAGSATEGLLWLKRGMEFIYVFLGEVARGEQALDVAAGKAYSKSLRRHHNWMVRGIFSLAMKAVPYYADFLAILGSDGSEESQRQVTDDMTVFAQNLGEICIILDQFLIEKNLETEH